MKSRSQQQGYRRVGYTQNEAATCRPKRGLAPPKRQPDAAAEKERRGMSPPCNAYMDPGLPSSHISLLETNSGIIFIFILFSLAYTVLASLGLHLHPPMRSNHPERGGLHRENGGEKIVATKEVRGACSTAFDVDLIDLLCCWQNCYNTVYGSCFFTGSSSIYII